MYQIEKSTVYFRDNFIPFDQASVSIASAPMLYGLSVYTVFSASWNEKENKLYIFRLREHYDRLVNSAKIMDFHAFLEEWSYERFEATMLELLKKNDIKEDVLVRANLFIDEILSGTRMHGLKNSLNAYIYPLGEILSRGGIHACVSSWQRTPDNAIPSRAKINGSYANASLMKNEALLSGFDDAIALDQHGHVSEGTVANLFIIRDGQLITPHSATDLLEGITRNSILAIADSLKIPHQQRSVDRSELYLADEAFMCGSSARIAPIISIDKRPVGEGKVGAITEQLIKTYDDIQRGTTTAFAEWRQAV